MMLLSARPQRAWVSRRSSVTARLRRLELRAVRAGEPLAERVDRAGPQQGEPARALVDVPVAASAGHPAGGCRSLRDLVGVGALGVGVDAQHAGRRAPSSTRVAYAACSSIMSTEEEWPSDAFGPFSTNMFGKPRDHGRGERRHALRPVRGERHAALAARRARRRADGSRRSRSRARARRPRDGSRREPTSVEPSTAARAPRTSVTASDATAG